jgi:hypothetical protein
VRFRSALHGAGLLIEEKVAQAALLILGHYRNRRGTTHLHNLLALDRQFAAPTFVQVLNPLTSDYIIR